LHGHALAGMPRCTVTPWPPEMASGDAICRLAGRLGGLGADDLLGLIMVLAVDRALEVVDAASNGTPDLGQPLRSEHDERDDENQEEMRWLENVADHGLESTPWLTA
jgi:hypothetical protein